MNRNFVKGIAFAIAAAMVITSLSFVIFVPSVFAGEGADNEKVTNTEEYTTQYLNSRLGTFKSYLEFINRNYKDSVSYKVLMDAAMEAVTEALEDPYSVYYKDKDEVTQFTSSVSKSYAGIGVTIGEENGRFCITDVNPFGSAYEIGVKKGDTFVSVNGKTLEGKSLSDLSSLLRGEPGTFVSFVVLRDGKEISFKAERAEIPVANISAEMMEDGIAYMLLSSFNSSAGQEFEIVWEELKSQGAKGLILDVRNNGGGFISAAEEIAELIMPAGKTVTFYKTQGKIQRTVVTRDDDAVEVPIVMLINGNSASATELLAGALKDNGFATLVGTNSYGKGVAQQVVSVGGEAYAKLSEYYFLTPKGKDIQKVGIAPDYTVLNGTEGHKDSIAEYEGFAPMNEDAKPGRGATGLNVYGAQQRLKLLGYYEGELSGIMDEGTVYAVMKFQRENGLYAYPVLDNSTRAKLEYAAYSYCYGSESFAEDLQLEKAMELVKKYKSTDEI